MQSQQHPSKQNFILHAPNVHMGGGLVLLQALLTAWKNTICDAPRWMQLDAREKVALSDVDMVHTCWVKRSFLSRLLAEWRLTKEAKAGDAILCFHGLPPLFSTSVSTVIFLQNRLLVSQTSLHNFSWKVRLRLTLERLWLKHIRPANVRYIVQTHSMKQLAMAYLGQQAQITVCPFVPDWSIPPASEKQFDFFYCADDLPHKNHENLLTAWELLAKEQFFPSLALTLPDGSPLLLKIDRLNSEGCVIHNLGKLSHAAVLQTYAASGALIYPSLVESFGLPLLEAQACNLPIIAAELDYVRDVVEPVATFDPQSPTSIARSVKRFMGKSKPPISPQSASEFITEIMQ